jgi:hypothetical protein
MKHTDDILTMGSFYEQCVKKRNDTNILILFIIKKRRKKSWTVLRIVIPFRTIKY